MDQEALIAATVEALAHAVPSKIETIVYGVTALAAIFTAIGSGIKFGMGAKGFFGD